MLKFLKKKESDKEAENIEMIPVPDIRAYMIKGYEEIREVKRENEELKQKVKDLTAESIKNKQLYEAQLVVAQEFENRYNKVVKCPLCGNGALPHIWDKKKELKQEEKITYRTNQDNRYENLHTALFKNGKKEVLSESIKPGFKKIKIESDGFITKVYINNIEQKYIENLLIFQNAGEIMDIYLNTNEEVKNNEIYDN